MTLAFWIAAALVLYTYAGYPLCIALLARTFPRNWRRETWPLSSQQKPVSIVMAVHNGERLLPWKLEHLLSIHPELVHEVIVVSDGSEDATNTILNAVDDQRCRAIILHGQVGKAAALNRGIAAAAGEVLLFIDIRPTVAEGAIPALLANFSDPEVGCVAGELILRTGDHDATAAVISGAYWRYEQWIRNCEARFDSPVGVYGGFYAVRRGVATEIPAGTILDDMYQPLAIIRQGYRSVIDRTAVVYDTWPSKISGEFSRKVRTLAGNFQLIAIAPWTLSPRNRVLLQFVSHKVLRLFVPYLLLMTLVTSLLIGRHSHLYLAVAIAQIAFWLLAALSIRVRVPFLYRIGTPAGALLSLNAAAVVGFGKFLFTRGPLWKIWSPTETKVGA